MRSGTIHTQLWSQATGEQNSQAKATVSSAATSIVWSRLFSAASDVDSRRHADHAMSSPITRATPSQAISDSMPSRASSPLTDWLLANCGLPIRSVSNSVDVQ